MSSLRLTLIGVVVPTRLVGVSTPCRDVFASTATICALNAERALFEASSSLNIRKKVTPFAVTSGQTKNPVALVKTQLPGANGGAADVTPAFSGETTAVTAVTP